jgi:hypothetical protein
MRRASKRSGRKKEGEIGEGETRGGDWELDD